MKFLLGMIVALALGAGLGHLVTRGIFREINAPNATLVIVSKGERPFYNKQLKKKREQYKTLDAAKKTRFHWEQRLLLLRGLAGTKAVGSE